MEPLFKKKGVLEKHPAVPTSYGFFSKANAGQKKITPPVVLVFPPNGNMVSWGFLTDSMRFNIYPNDPRHEECEVLVALASTSGMLLRLKYSEDEHGLATLVKCSKKSAFWEQRGTFWRVKEM